MNDIDIEESCGNIFEDLSLKNAKELSAKSNLLVTIRKLQSNHQIELDDLTNYLKISKKQIFTILHENEAINESLNTLFDFYIKLNKYIKQKSKLN